MNPAFKTTSILAIAGAISAAALFLAQSTPSAISAHSSNHSSDRSAIGNGPLQLRTQLASSHVLRGTHQSYMAVTLTAPEDHSLSRPDVDIAVVLDHSGSMEGEKLAQAKLAARQLIGNLHQNDRFSLVAYGTEVEILMPTIAASDAAKLAAMDTISSIYADGGTNLSGGMQAAAAQLIGLKGTNTRVKRIVLISDGQANEGIINPAKLNRLAANTAAQGVSTTTVGIGLDFDEKSMTGIAVSGGGNYYFAESAGMLAELFDTELSRLGATVATQLSLRIKTMPGVRLQEILGHSMVAEGDAWVVRVADMHAGETRKVVLALQVNASGNDPMAVAQVHASYLSAVTGDTGSAQNELFAAITGDMQVVVSNRNPDSNRLIERALTAQAIDKATILYEQGRSSDAQQLIRTRTQSAQKSAMDFGDEEFAAEMSEAQDSINMNFAKAPARSTGGKRARKKNRNAAYEMMK